MEHEHPPQPPSRAAELAALIGSRICHDLISPIGAIANGLELLSMAGGPAGPEMDLISDSADNAGARIGFFRIAYGTAGEQMMAAADIRAILSALMAGGRVQVDWQPQDPQPRSQVRLAFLALQCCESALPHGGTITIRTGDGWEVTGTGDTVSPPQPVWDTLENTTPCAATPATVQFALLPDLTRQAGMTLHTTATDGRVTLRLQPA